MVYEQDHPFKRYVIFMYFLSQIEPKLFFEAESDKSWMIAMQEELN